MWLAVAGQRETELTQLSVDKVNCNMSTADSEMSDNEAAVDSQGDGIYTVIQS